jgi:hypothetical protein
MFECFALLQYSSSSLAVADGWRGEVEKSLLRSTLFPPSIYILSARLPPQPRTHVGTSDSEAEARRRQSDSDQR